MVYHDKLLRETLKMIKRRENFIRRILDDAEETNLRLVGVVEKLEDSTRIIKKSVYRNHDAKLSKYGERFQHTGK